MKTVKISLFRFNPVIDNEPHYTDFNVPVSPGMTVMDALDYIYFNIDGTIAYNDHAGCTLGICYRCNAKINGKSRLLCQTPIDGDVKIEPVLQRKVIRDLVYKRGK